MVRRLYAFEHLNLQAKSLHLSGVSKGHRRRELLAQRRHRKSRFSILIDLFGNRVF
jgi:hypothetical protein